MIIVRLKGGLGNQMFQYAAAKQLAEKLNTSLKLDISFLQNNAADSTNREFELDKFSIPIEIASAEEVKKVREKKTKNFIRPTVIREKYFGFVKPFLKAGNDYYMNGYWQSDKYFADVEAIIRSEFKFIEPLSDEYYIGMQGKIVSSNSVSLHFRRGDYVSNSKTNKYHGVCSLAYYQNAVKTISDKISNPHLFVFSDDIDWVKSNFHTGLPTVFVEKKNENLHTDFRLMSMCRHNIIANSSYSWWAAWLNPNKEKIVIAPRRWYRNKRKQLKAADRVPNSWIRI
ncbi:MAG: alpha-1,2-fucosyltransferase [Bacteroidia bacterium]|nr:alpha-1,2-fucosyltransferase [Bacteroidia bacterium]